jgi:hypothetical protein
MVAMRAHAWAYLPLAAVVLVLYLALHALHCVTAHPDSDVPHAVGNSAQIDHHHDHQVDHCDPADESPVPLAAPRVADSGGLALSALPLLSLAHVRSAGGFRRVRPRDPSTARRSRSGRDTLHALCVSRR